ncbi:DUF3107 domain-containing protein [Corynebacterium timonense]|uniref:ATP-binding protein n=1 Tax=Corynebacterium timonense TaxID=441500 RepID=A0A1H1RNK7_9CORY|nr:DUF3107 domain-containing protein [Corynebacterium timonense]SDS37285.1 Protein of unknown function [Corynebacterium timonense]
MDIKIGLAESPRELVITTTGDQEDLLSRITRAIEGGEPTLTLTDDRGRSFIIRTERISYVEVGNATSHTVGFAS